MSVRSSASALTLCSLDHANLTSPEGFDLEDVYGYRLQESIELNGCSPYPLSGHPNIQQWQFHRGHNAALYKDTSLGDLERVAHTRRDISENLDQAEFRNLLEVF